jgi:O-antigen/teichoic acid export membrane protein
MFSIIKNVAKHSVIYGLSDVLSRAIGFFMIPLYTYYLTPANYGVLELLDLTCYIVGMLVAMGIGQAVVKYYYEYDEEENRNQVISVALITLWVVSAIALVILIFFSHQISNIVFQTRDYYHLFNIIFISTIIGLTNEIPLTLLRIKEKSITYVSISLTKLTVNLSLNILFIVKFKMGILGILYSSLI